jgi:hypothetical protein
MPSEQVRQRQRGERGGDVQSTSNVTSHYHQKTINGKPVDWKVDYEPREFGGAKGTAGIIIFSHFLMLYFWCLLLPPSLPPHLHTSTAYLC